MKFLRFVFCGSLAKNSLCKGPRAAEREKKEARKGERADVLVTALGLSEREMLMKLSEKNSHA